MDLSVLKKGIENWYKLFDRLYYISRTKSYVNLICYFSIGNPIVNVKKSDRPFGTGAPR